MGENGYFMFPSTHIAYNCSEVTISSGSRNSITTTSSRYKIYPATFEGLFSCTKNCRSRRYDATLRPLDSLFAQVVCVTFVNFQNKIFQKCFLPDNITHRVNKRTIYSKKKVEIEQCQFTQLKNILFTPYCTNSQRIQCNSVAGLFYSNYICIDMIYGRLCESIFKLIYLMSLYHYLKVMSYTQLHLFCP